MTVEEIQNSPNSYIHYVYEFVDAIWILGYKEAAHRRDSYILFELSAHRRDSYILFELSHLRIVSTDSEVRTILYNIISLINSTT